MFGDDLTQREKGIQKYVCLVPPPRYGCRSRAGSLEQAIRVTQNTASSRHQDRDCNQQSPTTPLSSNDRQTMKRLAHIPTQFARDHKTYGWDCTRQIIAAQIHLHCSILCSVCLVLNVIRLRALFSLKPFNDRAHDVVAHPCNETLSDISHPHIVDYIASQGWDGQDVEIFIGLKEGTLESLVKSSGGLPAPVADSVFPQMLQALDCLACIQRHRASRCEAREYSLGTYRDRALGDFRLCNHIINAAIFAGTYLYMPPEMLQEGEQIYKVDVWSLFITMLWILDAGEFLLSAALNVDSVFKIREIAAVNPKERASAA
ncbi:hypothetical protein LAWI1_G001544 [Lachnellula willkommii]|uniref:non-specific serine/threonine protein kinase n=1 Tax=Lachnellula willkommii TaxID=215461 RepID=A0A559MIA6_9HELO|nr:hypothetical protein LAWI1_G001544 [Lachnellula willkommii]